MKLNMTEPNEKKLLNLILKVLDEKKAENITTLNVKKLTSVTDFFVICTAPSKRHAKALLRYLLEEVRQKLDLKPYGVEGDEEAEWILLDFLSVVIHIMQPDTREFYNLESLWRMTQSLRKEEESTSMKV
jgi:ribosome-associated protein